MSFWDNLTDGLGAAGAVLGFLGGRRERGGPNPNIATYDYLTRRIQTFEQIRQMGVARGIAIREADNLDHVAALFDLDADALAERSHVLSERAVTLTEAAGRRLARGYETVNARWDYGHAMRDVRMTHAEARIEADRQRSEGSGEAALARAQALGGARVANAEARAAAVAAAVDAAVTKAQHDITRTELARAQAQGKLETDVAQSGVGSASWEASQSATLAEEAGRRTEELQGRIAAEQARARAAATQAKSARTMAAANVEYARLMATLDRSYVDARGSADLDRLTGLHEAERVRDRTTHRIAIGEVADRYTREQGQLEDLSFQGGALSRQAGRVRTQGVGTRIRADTRRTDADTLDVAMRLGRGGLRIHPGVTEYGGTDDDLARQRGIVEEELRRERTTPGPQRAQVT